MIINIDSAVLDSVKITDDGEGHKTRARTYKFTVTDDFTVEGKQAELTAEIAKVQAEAAAKVATLEAELAEVTAIVVTP